MECVRFFRNMGFAPGVMNRQCDCRNVKACEADLSQVFGWNQPCQRIFACGCDDSGSWSPLPKKWIAGWLRIHEKVIKHAKWRHMDSINCSKHLHVVQVIARSHASVPWMYVEQHIALFLSEILSGTSEENISPSVCAFVWVSELSPAPFGCHNFPPPWMWEVSQLSWRHRMSVLVFCELFLPFLYLCKLCVSSFHLAPL